MSTHVRAATVHRYAQVTHADSNDNLLAMARLGNLLALLSTALLATESQAAKRTFAKKKGKTQMWITIIVVVGTVAARAD